MSLFIYLYSLVAGDYRASEGEEHSRAFGVTWQKQKKKNNRNCLDELSRLNQVGPYSPSMFLKNFKRRAMSKKRSTNTSNSVNQDFFKYKPAIPWGTPVAGEILLDSVKKKLQNHLVTSDHALTAMTLWIVHTYCYKSFSHSPILLINAPERACGKSVGLGLTARLASKSFECGNISVAAMFRVIAMHGPTLLIDEADTFIESNPEMAGILNKGYEDSGTVLRVEKTEDNFEPVAYSVFGPKAIAGISMDRRLAEATLSRCVQIKMRRKIKGETVQRLRSANQEEFDTLRSQISRFVSDNKQCLEEGYSDMPDELSDREQDNWEPLFTVAHCAGPRWLEMAREAALDIKAATDEPQSMSNNLLADIREVFLSLPTENGNYIPSAELIELLCEDEEKGWSTYNRGDPLTQRQLAKSLRAYDIRSKSVRMPNGTSPKGYELREFDEVFRRYLPEAVSEDAANLPEVAAPADPKFPDLNYTDESLGRTSEPLKGQGLPDVDF